MKSKSLALSFALIILTLTLGAPAQQPPAPPDLYPNFFAKLKKGDYLGLLLDMRRKEAGYRADARTHGTFLELMSVINSQVGNYAEAHAYLDEFASEQDRPSKDVERAPFDAYEARDAVETIRAAADSHQVIMINEEHDTPMHRAFTARLLPVLYAKGFRYLAAETLAENGDELQRRGYPTQKTGFYTADPVYGDMIRTALRLGFKLVAYEYIPRDCTNPPDNADFCQNERERGQAQNLYDRVLKNDPKAKLLVHVGRGHHQEVNAGTWAMMGWHFKEITKIDPFTIEQMHMSERSRPEFETALYRYAMNKWRITEPTVFRSKDGKLWGQLGNDLVVFHPRTRYERGRPTWLQLGGARKTVALYGNVVGRVAQPFINAAGGTYLVQAFYEVEGDDAIPVDQIVVTNTKDAPVVVLPKGRFRVRAVDESGKVVASASLAMD